MPIFFCIPTADAAKCSAAFARWKARGYSTAALTDGETPRPDHCDIHLHVETYRGWPWATNLLMGHVLEVTDAPFVIGGGDDMDNDPNADPMMVAMQCVGHFGESTLGVMQPTGDPMGIDASGRCAAERICGSPWIGREFFRRFDGGQGTGKGVFCEKFRHFFADELVKRQTEMLGMLWQRKDLTHFHRHPTRTGEEAPAYMRENQKHWAADEAVFRAFELAGIENSRGVATFHSAPPTREGA